MTRKYRSEKKIIWKKIDTKEYEWGIVNYFSDGSEDIINSKIDMFVRNAKDIKCYIVLLS